jgi:serine/threonine-protein kinase
VVAEIPHRERQGRPVDPARYAESFPHLAGRLREYFADRAVFDHFADALRPRPEEAARQDVTHELGRAEGALGPGEDLRTQLQKRLLFISLLLTGFYAIYLFKWVVFYGLAGITGWLFIPVTFLNAVVAAVLLSSRRRFPLPALRVVELVLVGLPMLNQIDLEYRRLFVERRMATYLESGLEETASGRFHVLPWCILIIGYAVLVPNTWRRCYAVVSAIAGVAVAMNVCAAARDGVLLSPSGAHHLLEVALWLGWSVAFAVYNAYRIDVLIRVAQYRLLEKLGAGGMGVVYAAKHALLKRRCAIKVIRPERAGDDASLRFFQREVQAAAGLTHPNTVRIFDYGVDANTGRFYFVMEHLPGPNLDGFVHSRGVLSAGRVVYLLRQLCSALQEAHGQGLVHRDIKPSNLILCERGGLYDVCKLLDFGLVRAVGPGTGGLTTWEGTIAGTPEYMSPEQARGESKAQPVDARSDLYSLGATAYFLLTGRPPFVRGSAILTLAAHLEAAPEALTHHRPDVPADLEAVVLCCLEKDPSRRYTTAQELEEALAACACAAEWDAKKAAAWWQAHPSRVQSGQVG